MQSVKIEVFKALNLQSIKPTKEKDYGIITDYGSKMFFLSSRDDKDELLKV